MNNTEPTVIPTPKTEDILAKLNDPNANYGTSDVVAEFADLERQLVLMTESAKAWKVRADAAAESHSYWKAQWNAQTAWLEIEKEKTEKLTAQVAKLREALESLVLEDEALPKIQQPGSLPNAKAILAATHNTAAKEATK